MAVNVERLKLLIEALKLVPEKQFDLDTWLEEPNGFDSDSPFPSCSTRKEMKECGFAGCAVGWGALYKPLRDEGLTLLTYKELDEVIVCAEPAYSNARSWAAVRDFFGLTYEEALYLFNGGSYQPRNAEGFIDNEAPWHKPGPGEVIARIREMIARA